MANADALGQSVEADKAAISSAAAQIQADDANLDNIKLQLSFTTIYAPIDGRAGNVTVKAGNIVNASQTELLSIAQVQPIYVTFSVPESKLEDIQRFMGGGRLVVEATGQEDAARVERGLLTFIDNLRHFLRARIQAGRHPAFHGRRQARRGSHRAGRCGARRTRPPHVYR
jgi:multidrug efflux system membrane fusion protein